MRDLDYVIGRLQGLYELVVILKDQVGKKGAQNSKIVTTLTEHISEQLESILEAFDSLDVKAKHKAVLEGLKEKHMPEEAPEQAPKKAARKKPEPARKAATREAQKREARREAPAEEIPEEEVQKPSAQKAVLEKHEKTVDDLLKELESMRSQ